MLMDSAVFNMLLHIQISFECMVSKPKVLQRFVALHKIQERGQNTREKWKAAGGWLEWADAR